METDEMQISLEAQIEALLFWSGEPMRMADIARALSREEGEIEHALKILEEKFSREGSGLVLLRKDDEAALGTVPAMSGILENLEKEELSREVGKAALEVLAIALYRGPIGKAEIDCIRGVNSSSPLRHLLVRGLLERMPHPERSGGILYSSSFELLQHLGISKKEDLPEYNAFREKLEEGGNVGEK